MDCKICPYFDKKKTAPGSSGIVGTCKLRQKTVTEKSMTEAFCKDRATGEVRDASTASRFMGEPSGNKVA